MARVKAKSSPAARRAAALKSIGTKNGRVLTVTHLPEAAYQAFHRLPYGMRMQTLRAVIVAVGDYAKQMGPDWHKGLLEKSACTFFRLEGRKRKPAG